MKKTNNCKMRNAVLRLSLVIFALLFLLTACSGEDTCSISEESSSVAEGESSLLASDENEDSVSADVLEDGFYILYTENEVDFSKAPKAEINHYPWNSDYNPYAYGQAIFKKDDGFYIYMYCKESNPKTQITEIGGDVYLDSALEFFCDYSPKENSTKRNYINLEMNSAGVYLAQYGQKSILELSDKRITVTGNRKKDYWTVTAHIPMEVLKDIYGDIEIGEGSVVACNFTKCGSGTKIKHWGTWQLLGGTSPNFHQPQYFAKVQIRK